MFVDLPELLRIAASELVYPSDHARHWAAELERCARRLDRCKRGELPADELLAGFGLGARNSTPTDRDPAPAGTPADTPEAA